MILHIVTRDKSFTKAYILFHERYFGDRENYFFAVSIGQDSTSPLPDLPNVCPEKNYAALLDSERFNTLSGKCDKVIVSGIWGDSGDFLTKLPKNIADKTYLQFWGGDFYRYRKISPNEFMEIKGKRSFFNFLRYVKYSIRNQMNKMKLAKCIRRCRCCIVLIEGDVMKLREIFPQAKQVLVAPMGGQRRRRLRFAKVTERLRCVS